MSEITLTWYVSTHSANSSAVKVWVCWCLNARLGIDDPADLDEVYNRLDERDWKADEALFELASDHNWLESSEAEISDLTDAEVTR